MKKDNQGGYIALISAVIISFVLIGLTFGASSAGYFSRFNVANSEYKRVSLGLSESCVNLALLSIAQDYNYAPSSGGDTKSVGSQNCLIKSVTYGPEVAGRKTAFIATQADYQGSFSNVKVSATIASTTYSAASKATLSVVVSVTNDSGGTKQPSDFTVNVTGGNPTLGSFAGDVSGVTVIVDAGAIVSETPTNFFGYSVSYSPSCNLALLAGAHATCTIYLNDPPTTASLTLIVNVKNDNGGIKSPADFPIYLDGDTVNPKTSGIAITGLAPGSHTASAAATPSGYTVSSWGYDCGAGGTITLVAGDVKTCTINYDDIPPPAPACADTVVMIDRTGSLSSSDLASERAATKALLDLYSNLSPRPQVGIGRFGGASGSNADIVGQLTSDYGTSSLTGSTATKPPSSIGTPAAWANGSGAYIAGDSQFAISSVSGQQETYKTFGLSVPGGATVSGIQVDVSGLAESGYAVANTSSLVPVAAGAPNSNSWTGNTGFTTIAGKIAAATTSDSDTSYLASATANASMAYGFQGTTTPSGAVINSVTLFAVMRSPTVGGTVRLRVEDAGNTVSSTSAQFSPGTSYAATSWTMPTNPITGAAWTSADVASWPVRFGVTKVNTTAVRFTQLYLVVNYSYVPPTIAPVKVDLSYNNGANWSSASTVTLTEANASFSLGSATSTWGRAWSGNELSDANFVVRLTNTATSGYTVAIDSITVKVNYLSSTGLYAAIDSNLITTSSGGTDISSGINVGNGEVSGVRHDTSKAKVLIVLSDGLDTVTSSTTVLNAADTSKTSGTKIYFLHFGSGSGNDLAAKIASGTTTVPGHQPGSKNDAGTASGNVSQANADKENGDGDNFFISPTFDQLKAIFEQVGTAVCPAAGAASTPPPTNGTLVVITHMVNDNGGTKQPSDFTMQLSGVGLNPSLNNFSGADAPGISVSVSSTTPGNNYSVTELGFGGYSPAYGAGCSGAIGGGETKTCTVTNDDNAPAPPPPPPPPPGIDIGPWQEATSTPP